MTLLDGEPLSEGPFIVKLTAEQIGLIAWALMRYADSPEVHADNKKSIRDQSYWFAGIVGIH